MLHEKLKTKKLVKNYIRLQKEQNNIFDSSNIYIFIGYLPILYNYFNVLELEISHPLLSSDIWFDYYFLSMFCIFKQTLINYPS